MMHNVLQGGITEQRERLVLDDRLFFCSQSVVRLNKVLLVIGSCYEVDSPGNRNNLSYILKELVLQGLCPLAILFP